jgi:hypothetical protein
MSRREWFDRWFRTRSIAVRSLFMLSCLNWSGAGASHGTRGDAATNAQRSVKEGWAFHGGLILNGVTPQLKRIRIK